MKYRNLSNIFDNDSDSDGDIKTNKEYAKNYDVWRKKEELNKLKTKYGEDIDNDEDSSSSSEDDEEGIELTEQNEKDFFKTLACLKNKDPRIYDENVQFFKDKEEGEPISKRDKKKNKDGPMYLKDYERKIILEKGGVLSDDEGEEDSRPRSPTYIEEQNRIKENLKSALNSVKDEEEDGAWGGLFKQRKKTKDEKQKEEVDYKKWLSGQEKRIDDKEVETELTPLKEYWQKPDLDRGEKFLRDYILNTKFLDRDEEDYIPTYDEIIHDSDQDLSVDEETIEKQEEFEHKYNFRFEDPDQEFIKRYPRTIENSVRKKDDRRKLKRMETAERKKKEKDEKMKDLKKLQDLKKKEIQEKLEKLREITGNTDLGFADEDVDGDFDPEAHDKRMQALFNEEFYQHPEDDQKPEFPDLDKELEIENWERYEGETENDLETAPHCEDDSFIMDCDYDPQASTQKELIESSRGKKKRKRKSKFAEAVSKPKPKFDPSDRNYEKYFEEYYKLDCEDFIGDLPCRFKYRKVVPNDFGLSTEEILLAKERELNKWCSLKKTVQIRPDHVEKYDQIAYRKKSENINLKQRILPSLFTLEGTEAPENESIDSGTVKNASQKKVERKEDRQVEEMKADTQSDNLEQAHGDNNREESVLNNRKKADKKKKKKKKKQAKWITMETVANQQKNQDGTNILENPTADQHATKQKLKKKKTKLDNTNHNVRKRMNSEAQNEVPRKKFKKAKSQGDRTKKSSISDARLAAYGINPKKYKNKLKYGKT